MKRNASRIPLALLGLLLCCTAQAATVTTAGNGNWSSTTNNAPWPGGVLPAVGDTVVINNNNTVTVDSNRTCAALTIAAGNAQTTLNINNNVTLTVTGAVTINAGTGAGDNKNIVLLGAGSIFDANSLTMVDSGGDTRQGVLNIGAGTANITGNISFASTDLRNRIDFNGGTLNFGAFAGAGGGGMTFTATDGTLNPTNNTTFSGIASGAGVFTKLGTATLTLSGTNTFGTTAGQTISINGGVVAVAANAGLGSTNNSVTLNGGDLRTTATFTSARNVVINTAVGTIDVTAGTFTLSGVVSGANSLAKTGAGTLVLSGTNTFGGVGEDLSIAAGTLQISANANLGDANNSVTIADSATFAISTGGPLAIPATHNFIFGTGTNGVNISMPTGTTDLNPISIQGNISGSNGFNLRGNADAWLLLDNQTQVPNTFVGPITLFDATNLLVSSDLQLGDLSNDIVFTNNSALGATGNVITARDINVAGGFLLARPGTIFEVDGVISGTDLNCGFTRFEGTILVSGVNTYTNLTTICAGTLEVIGSVTSGVAGPLGSSTTAVRVGHPTFTNHDASFLMATPGATIDRPISVTANGTGTMAVGGSNLSGTVSFNSTVTLLKATTLTSAVGGRVDFNGVVSGGFAVTKTGAGTVALAATNTYTGATTVSAGTLLVNGSTVAGSAFTVGSGGFIGGSGTIGGTVNVQAGGGVTPGNGGAGSTGTLATGAFTLANTSLINVDLDTPGTSDRVTVTGALTLDGAITVTPFPNFTGGTYTIFTHTGALTNNTATFTNPPGYTLAVTVAPAGTVNLVVTATANVNVWDGGGANANWTTANNWNNNTLPTFPGAPPGTANLYFGSGFGSGNPLLNGAKNVSTININTPTGFTIANDTITIATGNITRFNVAGSESIHTIASNVALGANGTWTIDGDNYLDVSGVTSGAFTLTKAGLGELRLTSSANSYSGLTTVSAGTLTVAVNNALGTTGSGTTVSTNATLAFTGGFTYSAAEPVSIVGVGVGGLGAINNLSGDNTFAGPITMTGTSSVGSTINTLTLTGQITGAFELDKVGVGTVLLNNATNSYSGATVIFAGTLVAASNNALGTNAANTTVRSGGTLGFTGGITYSTTETVNISGFGASSAGAINNLSGNNSFAGPVVLQENSSIGSTLNTLTLSGQLSGGYSMSKVGVGTVVLSNATNNYFGTTAISAGTLIAAANNALGQTTYGTTVLNGATLGFQGGIAYSTTEAVTINGTGFGAVGAINNVTGVNSFAGRITLASNSAIGAAANSLSLSGQITGGFNLSKVGAGVVTFTNTANNYGGLTDIAAGTLQVGGTGQVIPDASAVTVALGAILDANGLNETIGSLAGAGNVTLGAAANTLTAGGNNSTTTFSGVMSGSGAFTKTGTGALTFSNTNTYAGATSVNGGTLIATANGALGTAAGATTVASGATLGLSGGFNYSTAEAVTINGVGAGSVGALNSIAGNNTFAGAVTLGSAATIASSTVANTLTLSAAVAAGANALTFDGLGDLSVSAGITGGAGTVTMNGDGLLTIAGTSTYTGTTTLNSGTTWLTGSLAAGAGTTTVNNGAILGGTGTLRVLSVANGGTVAPGTTGAGILNSGNATFVSGAELAIELNGATVGTGYDRLNVTGTVNLGGSDLLLTVGYVPADADTWTIIANDNADAVTGTFNGLAEGAVIVIGTRGYQISYVGGTGNDVVLNHVPVVTNVTSTKPDGTYGAGTVIDIDVTFSMPVTVTGTPRLQLNSGGSVFADYNSGSGTSTITFRYTVGSGDATLDLDYTNVNALTLNGGTMSSAAGRPAVRLLPVPGATGSLGFNKNIVIRAAVITARETVDADGDGLLDAIRITTDINLGDNFTGLTITVAGYSLTGAPFDTGATANDNEMFVRLTELTLPQFTGDTDATPTVTVTASGLSGLPTGVGAVPMDKAQPVLLSAELIDVSGGGVSAFDTLYLYFSESVETAGAVLASDSLGLPVTGDSLSTSSLAAQPFSTIITITLLGSPILTPGGTYGPGAVNAGDPTGLYIKDLTTHFADIATNTALTGIAKAVDLQPGMEVVAIAWDDLSSDPKEWDMGNVSINANLYKASEIPLDLTVRNIGNVRQAFLANCSASTPSGWTVAAAPGPSQFRMQIVPNPPFGTPISLSGANQAWATQLYSGHQMSFDLFFTTPTTISAGQDVQQTMIVTLTAIKN